MTGPAAAQATRQPITVDRFLALKALSDPQIAPDGKLVAFTVSEPSLDQNRNRTRVWLAQVESGDAWEVTSGAGNERAPRWSPDGRVLAYISTRDGTAQIWQLPVRGGEPVRVTSVPGGISDFWWSPSGKAYFYTADVDWPAESELKRREGPYTTQARLWTDLMYRHWNEFRAGRRQHLFRLEAGDSSGADITPLDRDVPTLALGGRDVAFSQFGTEVAVVFNPDTALALSTNNDIFVMGPDGSSRQALTTNPANDHSPA